MRTSIALLLVGLSALAIADSTNVDLNGKQYKPVGNVFLEKQKNLLRLFKFIFQSNYYKDQTQIATTYKFEENLEQYTNEVAVKEFVHLFEDGLLPRGEVFSIFYEEQREQAIALFRVLYFAKDWETFYKTACWAREYVNEGMFVYAMHVAVQRREDTQGMVLPPIYEIYPYFFVNSEVIDKAYEYKMKYGGNYQGTDKQDKYYVQANYSGWYLNTNSAEYDMSYFTEDVDLNAFYYYFNIDYPFWMSGEEYGLKKDRRGELYYFLHQQILARYYMERLSNDYGSIDVFNWKEPIKTGYVPSMRYPNGLKFPVRPAYSNIGCNTHNQAFTNTAEDNFFRVQQIEDFERRIRDTIDIGYFVTEDGNMVNLYEKDGFETLGRLIESNPDSPNTRVYGALQVITRQVLGYFSQPIDSYKINPSVLEQFETSLRDPMFYQFYKRITYYFLQYKSHLPRYTYTQLNFPGVEVVSVEVDKLVTFFDRFDFDITNALYVTEEEFEKDTFQVRARQFRLNHKPFKYMINVLSDKNTDAVVRVFLGPKYDEQGREIPMNENRVNFVEFDQFPYALRTGYNRIDRNSLQTKTIRDRTTYRTLYQHVLACLNGEEEFHLDMTEAVNGFPNRFVLPKGKEQGQMYQFYVYIDQYDTAQERAAYNHVSSAKIDSGPRYLVNRPFGYPLDRQIKNESTFFVPNSFVQDVLIFHKTEGEVSPGRY